MGLASNPVFSLESHFRGTSGPASTLIGVSSIREPGTHCATVDVIHHICFWHYKFIDLLILKLSKINKKYSSKVLKCLIPTNCILPLHNFKLGHNLLINVQKVDHLVTE